MVRATRLKVYRTPIGFHDAYVAAPSQKAALKAWGSAHDLFSTGEAELVTDAALTEAPLDEPGKIVRRVRGTTDEHIAALPAEPQAPAKPEAAPPEARHAPPRKLAKPRPASKPRPPPKPRPEPKPRMLKPDQAAVTTARAELKAQGRAEHRHGFFCLGASGTTASLFRAYDAPIPLPPAFPRRREARRSSCMDWSLS